MNRDTLRQIVNILSFILTVVVNGLANGLPLNGLTTAEISNSFPVLFTPANYVFAIWGLIYLGLIAFAVFQALPAQRENPRLRRVGYWFALANIANAVWIFTWHYLVFAATEVAMLTLLVSLIVIYRRLEIGHTEVKGAQRWLVNIPFSIYLGWITVATVANTAVLLYDSGWDGFGISAPLWTAVMLLVATILGIVMILRRNDVAYALVLVWAFVGIVQKQSDTQLVAFTAAVMAAVIVVLLIVSQFLSRKDDPGNLGAAA